MAGRAMVFICLSCSFPFKGKAGMGMGFGWWRFGCCRSGWETHPHPTRPARRSAPCVRAACAAMPRKQAALTPLKGRALKGGLSALRGGLELGGPALLDLADQFRRQRHVVEFGRLLLAVLQRPGEELAGRGAALRVGGLLVHQDEVRGGDRPRLLAGGVGDDQVEVLHAGPVGGRGGRGEGLGDRKSTRLNSSHVKISYAVFCLKKKNIQ